MTVKVRFRKEAKTSGQEKEASDRLSSQSFSASIVQHASKTVVEQARGMTEEFKKNGLPWTGPQTRSLLAGGSGILYCLPALFCKSNRIEQCIWCTQAFLSVMADYAYIDRDSWFHGIDRFFATANALAVMFRASYGLKLDTLIIATIPFSAFILANRSKQQRCLQWWIYYHFLWHVTSSTSVAYTVYLLYNCPDYDEDLSSYSYPLDRFCLTKTT
jgi:hypothetical protein